MKIDGSIINFSRFDTIKFKNKGSLPVDNSLSDNSCPERLNKLKLSDFDLVKVGMHKTRSDHSVYDLEHKIKPTCIRYFGHRASNLTYKDSNIRFNLKSPSG